MEQTNGKNQSQMMQTFVNELPQLRKAINISQTDLGGRLGLSRQTISSIERGEVPMTWAVYVAAVTFFQGNQSEDELTQITDHWAYISDFMKGR